ncbi:CAAX prenyl protease-related protein [Methylotenera sp.]|uniref:CAAX prenyl protease-related protein n=2 Tax=Methylotenera sp. TaxID=2051956 RepID=UPI00272477F9|nr:CAAX prenyl protease-related protein [Methylotenera sp.]MDO9204581.1 CAAX prenyl protease-related protein [Methylotenera sp.]MDZ4211811.1 CAAX prenyl protease-related protein [Methylotenera sp.]
MSENMVNLNKILPRVLPFAIYILFLGLSDFLSPLLESVGIDSKWIYAIKIILVIALLIYFYRNYNELSVKPLVKDLCVGALAGLLVFLLWILPYPAWAILGGDVSGLNPNKNSDGIELILWLSVRICGAALIVPVMEELFWRSFVMRWIDNKEFQSLSPKNISFYALIVSSCLFGLEHQLWLAGLFAGVIYGLLYKIYKNLWVPIFAHAVTNGILGLWVMTTGNWQYW